MSAAEILRAERAAMCDTFEAVGPDAPTLCDGWLTADLAAHLIVREHRPDAMPGILAGGPFARHTASPHGTGEGEGLRRDDRDVARRSSVAVSRRPGRVGERDGELDPSRRRAPRQR